MITVFKKIWNFAEKDSRIYKSPLLSVSFVRHLMQCKWALCIMFFVKIFDETLSMKDIAIVLGILLVSLVGKIITQYISQLEQTHAGYFMAADKKNPYRKQAEKSTDGIFQ